jgi:hypothetical protein
VQENNKKTASDIRDSNSTQLPQSLWGLLYICTSSAKKMFLLLSFFVLCSLILLITIYFGLELITKKRVQIIQTNSGGLIYKIGNEETLSFLVSASETWAKTDFAVQAGDKLEFRVSGKVNTAIHHLVKAAEKDTKPDPPWIGPDGVPEDMLRSKQDKYRKNFLLLPDAPYGALIGSIGHEIIRPDNSSKKFLIGSRSQITLSEDQTGYLWLSVNEIILNKDRRLAYDVPENERDLGYKTPRSFDEIAKEEYWNLWYDDNVGYYFVNVKKTK